MSYEALVARAAGLSTHLLGRDTLTRLAERATRRSQRIADLASLATGCRDHHHFPPSGHVFRQRPARTEGLVVGMGEDYQQSRSLVTLHLVLHIAHSFVPHTSCGKQLHVEA